MRLEKETAKDSGVDVPPAIRQALFLSNHCCLTGLGAGRPPKSLAWTGKPSTASWMRCSQKAPHPPVPFRRNAVSLFPNAISCTHLPFLKLIEI